MGASTSVAAEGPDQFDFFSAFGKVFDDAKHQPMEIDQTGIHAEGDVPAPPRQDKAVWAGRLSAPCARPKCVFSILIRCQGWLDLRTPVGIGSRSRPAHGKTKTYLVCLMVFPGPRLGRETFPKTVSSLPTTTRREWERGEKQRGARGKDGTEREGE